MTAYILGAPNRL